ncbi:MAG: hypothetical protein KC441_01565 [Anaerolineales bacterium]|nr:hypothetical protein [Anaerolineales bacterium]
MTTFNREDSIDMPVLAEVPEAPEAGRKKLYVGDDGQFYAIDDQGNVTALQAAAGATQTMPIEFVALDEGAPPNGNDWSDPWSVADISAHGSGKFAIVHYFLQDVGNTGFMFAIRPNSDPEWANLCQWDTMVPADGSAVTGTVIIALDENTFHYGIFGLPSVQAIVFLKLNGFIA